MRVLDSLNLGSVSGMSLYVRTQWVTTHVLGLVVDGDGDRGLATSLRNLDRSDLRGEPASLSGRDGLLVGADAVLVLILTGETVVVGALLTG